MATGLHCQPRFHTSMHPPRCPDAVSRRNRACCLDPIEMLTPSKSHPSLLRRVGARLLSLITGVSLLLMFAGAIASAPANVGETGDGISISLRVADIVAASNFHVDVEGPCHELAPEAAALFRRR